MELQLLVERQVEGGVGDKRAEATLEGEGCEILQEEGQVFFAEGLVRLGEIIEISSFLVLQSYLIVSFLNYCKRKHC